MSEEFDDNRTEVEVARDDSTDARKEQWENLDKAGLHEHEKLPRSESILRAADTIEASLGYLFGSGEDSTGDRDLDALSTLYSGNDDPDHPEDVEGRERAQKIVDDFRHLLRDIQLHGARGIIYHGNEVGRHRQEAERIAKSAGSSLPGAMIEAAKEDMKSEAGLDFNDGSQPHIYPENQGQDN